MNVAAKPPVRPFAVGSAVACFITLLVAACSPTTQPVRVSDREMSAAPTRAATAPNAGRASPMITSNPRLTAPQPGSQTARTTVARFESAWCRFRWDEPPAVRLARARAYMTPAAAALLRVPYSWWVGQIRPNRTVAQCSRVQVFAPDAPSDGSRTVLRTSIVRFTRDEATGGTARETVRDQRWLVRSGDRWLVDVPTEGG